MNAMAAGTRITTATGFSTYTYDPDTAGVSNCSGGCAKAWPPVPAPAVVNAPFSIVVRADGTKQLAYDQKPLYTFVNDKVASDEKGDGIGGIWHLAIQP